MKTLNLFFLALVMMLISGACRNKNPGGPDPVKVGFDLVTACATYPSDAYKWVDESVDLDLLCRRINRTVAGSQKIFLGQVVDSDVSGEKKVSVKVDHADGSFSEIYVYVKEFSGNWRVMH